MSSRNNACRWALVSHFVVAMLVGLPALFFVGTAARWIHWWWYDYTIVKLLGATMICLGVGSLLAARDPLRHRIVVQMEIVFTFVATIALGYRLIWQASTTPRVGWVFLVLLAAFFVTFSVLYPRSEKA